MTDRSDEQLSFLAGLAFAMTALLIVFTAKPGLEKQLLEDSPIPPVAGTVIFVALLGITALVTARYSKPLAIVVCLAMTPGIVSNAAIRLTEPDPAWTNEVRALGVLALLVVSFGGLLLAGRRSREFEKYLFTEATSVAFFATLIAAGAYAALQPNLDLPRLSFGWVPLIGLAAWGASAAFISRRMR